MKGLSALFAPKALVALAVEVERTYAHGAAVGLSGEDVNEVIVAWERHYMQTPWPLDWDEVRHAVTRRAFGQEWKP